MLSIIALILWAHLLYASNGSTKFTKISNLTLNHVISTKSVLSAIQCCTSCAIDTDCLAVNYDSSLHICQRNNKGPNDVSATSTPTQNIDVYYKTVAIVATCEAGWLLYNSECYLVINTEQTWAESEAECNSYNARLVDIQTEEENEFVAQSALSAGHNLIWIGLGDIWSGTSMAWTTGEQVLYTAFSSGQPNNHLDLEDCVELDTTTTLWNDNYCPSVKPSVCKKKA